MYCLTNMSYQLKTDCFRHIDREFGNSDCQRVTTETKIPAIVTNPI